MPSTTVITHQDCLNHEMPGHPERPERLVAVLDRINSSGMAADVTLLDAVCATTDQLQLIHPIEFISSIMNRAPTAGLIRIDPDTYMGSGSLRAASLAAGACLQAVDLVMKGATNQVFCAVRPPGHHAELAEAMGFCLFNSIALAAESALRHDTINRVAILDFDVHHCNGTVDIFKNREEVLVCSTFQADYYPNRYLDFRNDHIVPCPLPAGSGSQVFRATVENQWLPAIRNHKPDLILVSAGFDAHQLDPLAEINLTEDDYCWVTNLIKSQAAEFSQHRLISTLEGGYHLQALANSAEAHLQTLLDG